MNETQDPSPVDASHQEPRSHGAEEERQQRDRLFRAWETPRGWRYLSAVNNTQVGLWYLIGSFVFLFFGGALALLMRTQLALPEQEIIGQPLYDQLFTMHGSVMMFLFAVPVFEAFAILMLPEMLGARDLPFPRLSAFGFWCFAIGGVFFCGCLFFGIAPSGGWFMYPPLTSDYQKDVGPDIWLLGLSFIEIASISAAVELIVGVLRCRPPGMRIHLTPLYGWYVLVVGAMILFAFPPLIAGDILLEVERTLGWPFFDATRGGDPLLWQHLFWIFGHPEVYIVFLPSIALVAMMVPTFAGRPMIGYGWVVLSAVGVGFLSFGLWVHHMFTTGLPGISLGFFSAASEAVAIPTAVQLFCFLATMLAGRIRRRSVPILFVVGAFATFILGGLTGVMVALVPFDLQAHDSYFIVAHLHSVLIGGTLFPIIGAFYYYYPQFQRKFLSERLGKWAFWLMFIGFNITFLPMHVTGLRGMPRRVYTYAADLGLEGLNLTSTLGAFTLAAGFLVFAFDILRPKGKQDVPPNPWNAGTLEWVSTDPEMPWGVRSIPTVKSRYPLWDDENIVRDVAEGRGYLPDAEEGLRETLVTSTVDAVPMQCLRVSGPTFLTLGAASTLGGCFIFGTFHLWWLALGCGVAATMFILRWLWTGTAVIPEKPEKAVGHGLSLPIYVSGRASIGWWGMLITMLADVTAYISLVFGYFFYFTVHEGYPPANQPDPAPGWTWVALGLLVGAGAFTEWSRRLNRGNRAVAFYAALGLGCVCALLGSVALVQALRIAGMDPTSHVYPAIVWVLVLWTVAHVALGALMQAYCLARRIRGLMTPIYDAEICNTSLYWYFTTATVVVTIAVILGFPEAV